MKCQAPFSGKKKTKQKKHTKLLSVEFSQGVVKIKTLQYR